MIYKDDIANLRQDIMGKEGQKVIVKGALGRSKFFEKEAILGKAYSDQFGLKYDQESGSGSYTYVDVLTRTIDLQVFDGENYCSIIPPKVEEPKRIKQNTEDTQNVQETLE